MVLNINLMQSCFDSMRPPVRRSVSIQVPRSLTYVASPPIAGRAVLVRLQCVIQRRLNCLSGADDQKLDDD